MTTPTPTPPTGLLDRLERFTFAGSVVPLRCEACDTTIASIQSLAGALRIVQAHICPIALDEAYQLKAKAATLVEQADAKLREYQREVAAAADADPFEEAAQVAPSADDDEFWRGSKP